MVARFYLPLRTRQSFIHQIGLQQKISPNTPKYNIIPENVLECPCVALSPNQIERLINLKSHCGKNFTIFLFQSAYLLDIKTILNDEQLKTLTGNIQGNSSYKFTDLPYIYLKLAKYKLTSMVVMSQICGYLMCPGPFTTSTFVAAMIGTGLTSASANTINQYLEIPYDAQMKRTKNRVLVRNQINCFHALSFAAIAGLSGIFTLQYFVNSISSSLAAFNLFLYTCIYTRFKRTTILNTWIGAIVGAIPPLIGYYARRKEQSNDFFLQDTMDVVKNYCADSRISNYVTQFIRDHFITTSINNEQFPYFSILQTFESMHSAIANLFSNFDFVALMLASLLYTWQLPHFNSLSWNLKKEYSKAGYQMMCSVNPKLCLKTAYLHSIYSFCVVLTLLYLLHRRYKNRIKESCSKNEFAIKTLDKHTICLLSAVALLLPLSLYNIHLARNFYFRADSQSSRRLFRYSLIHLPSTLGVLLAYKSCLSSSNFDKMATGSKSPPG